MVAIWVAGGQQVLLVEILHVELSSNKIDKQQHKVDNDAQGDHHNDGDHGLSRFSPVEDKVNVRISLPEKRRGFN